MRKDKIIAFTEDVINRAAENSGYSKDDIRVAYRKFVKAFEHSSKNNLHTRIDIPLGTMYIMKESIYEDGPFNVSFGFNKPSGAVSDIINIVKDRIGLTENNLVAHSHYKGSQSLLKYLNMPIEEIEKYQNEDYKNNNK